MEAVRNDLGGSFKDLQLVRQHALEARQTKGGETGTEPPRKYIKRSMVVGSLLISSYFSGWDSINSVLPAVLRSLGTEAALEPLALCTLGAIMWGIDKTSGGKLGCSSKNNEKKLKKSLARQALDRRQLIHQMERTMRYKRYPSMPTLYEDEVAKSQFKMGLHKPFKGRGEGCLQARRRRRARRAANRALREKGDKGLRGNDGNEEESIGEDEEDERGEKLVVGRRDVKVDNVCLFSESSSPNASLRELSAVLGSEDNAAAATATLHPFDAVAVDTLTTTLAAVELWKEEESEESEEEGRFEFR